MKVLILGFSSIDDIDRVMEEQEVYKEIGYLFTLICGGSDPNAKPSVAREWAKERGCGVQLIFEPDYGKLEQRLIKEADYLVANVANPTAAQFLMKFKMEGKHGKAVRMAS